MNARSRWSLYIGAAVAVAVAALVVFLGLEAAGFDDPAPDSEVEATRTAAGGTPNYYMAAIVPPQDHEGDFPVTVAFAGGERIPYDPVALLDRIRSVDEPYTWLITYDDPPGSSERSVVQFDWDGNVLVQRILPWHADVFEPLLSLAGTRVEVRQDVSPPPSPTATPEPSATVVKIRGVDVSLPPGATLSIVEGACVGGSNCSTSNHQIIRMGGSFLSFNDYGIAGQNILPEHEDYLRPLLDVLSRLEWDPAPSSAQ
jgi:hypothetical protein